MIFKKKTAPKIKVDSRDIIVKMTPFIFEDGNTYYFDIERLKERNYSRTYITFDVCTVYEKKLVKNETGKSFWGKVIITESEEFISIGDFRLAVEKLSDKIKVSQINRKLKEVIDEKYPKLDSDFDGLVGNIPEHLKTALKRESNLNNILGK